MDLYYGNTEYAYALDGRSVGCWFSLHTLENVEFLNLVWIVCALNTFIMFFPNSEHKIGFISYTAMCSMHVYARCMGHLELLELTQTPFCIDNVFLVLVVGKCKKFYINTSFGSEKSDLLSRYHSVRWPWPFSAIIFTWICQLSMFVWEEFVCTFVLFAGVYCSQFTVTCKHHT